MKKPNTTSPYFCSSTGLHADVDCHIVHPLHIHLFRELAMEPQMMEYNGDVVPDPLATAIKTDWQSVTVPLTIDPIFQKTGTLDHRTKFYDDHAVDYEDDLVTAYKTQVPRYVAITMHKYLNENEDGEILDVACGSGLASKELKRLGNYVNVSGLDPSEKMLEQGIKKGRFKKVFHQYFTLDSGLPENHYDGILCSSGYAPGHLLSNTVREMCRILKPCGIMVIGNRSSYLTDPEISKLPTMLKQLEDEGLLMKLEKSGCPICSVPFSYDTGFVYVYQKRIPQKDTVKE